MKRLGRWTLLGFIAGTILVCDQVSKYAAVSHLTTLFRDIGAEGMGERLPAFVRERDLSERGLATPPADFVRAVWQWRYVQNRGAAFDFMARADRKVRVPFFQLITLAAVAFIIWYYRRAKDDQPMVRIALALLLGGALGNGLDRVLHGYVIDFIAWHWFDPTWTNPSRHWPTFNLADCGVSIGIALLLLDSLWQRKTAALDSSPQTNQVPH